MQSTGLFIHLLGLSEFLRQAVEYINMSVNVWKLMFSLMVNMAGPWGVG